MEEKERDERITLRWILTTDILDTGCGRKWLRNQ
jgi:hypothetical protein